MKITEFELSQSQQVTELFCDVFTASEGEPEGRLIGGLITGLLDTTETGDLIGFVADSGDRIVGAIFFSRFILPNDKVAFLLSPVAVASNCQNQGVGQQLINFGLGHLRSLGIDLVFTYGDPNYYSKVGFRQISESTVKAPLKLSYPHGWLAQSLSGSDIETVEGNTRCVSALNDQRYW